MPSSSCTPIAASSARTPRPTASAGGAAAEAVGGTIWDTWPAAKEAPLEELLREAMADRLSVHVEHHGLDASGQDVWWDIHILPIEPGLTIVVRDISTHKRREERAERLQALTAALAAALDPEDVGAAIIEHAMLTLGANAANVYVLDNGQELRSIAASGYEPGVLKRSRRLPAEGPAMMAEVARAGNPIVFLRWSATPGKSWTAVSSIGWR